MILKCLFKHATALVSFEALNYGWMVWKDCLSQNHGLLVNLYCGYVTFHGSVSCMFCIFGIERVNCTSFSYITADNLKLCIMSHCVCFMRMFGSFLINVLLNLTPF